MWRTVKNIAKINRQDILTEGAVYSVVFLIGLVIFFIVMGIDSSVAGFPVGSLLTWMCYAVMSLVGGTIYLMQSFNLMVSMGTTRGNFMLAYGIFRFLLQFAFLVWIKVLYLLEETLQRAIVSEVVEEVYLTRVFTIPMLLVYAAVTVVMQFFCGSMVLRYGKKALTSFWVIWMLGCFGIGPIIDTISKSMKERSLVGKLLITVGDGVGAMGPYGWSIVAGATAVLLVLIAVLSMRKQWVSL